MSPRVATPPVHEPLGAGCRGEAPAGLYLTDGAVLFRIAGEFESAGDGSLMVGLEDCRSLEVFHISARELRSFGMRRVVPVS
jgi:hypothetical protein